MGCGALTSVKASESFLTKPVLFKDRYETGPKLGKGSFGTVYLSTDLTTGEEVAVKILDPKANTDAECLAEIRVWKEVCNHNNVVRLIQVCQDSEKCWMVVMERCKGTVWDRLAKAPLWTVQDIRDDFTQILEAVQWMHDCGYLHRDIKAENVLYGGPDGRTPKLADFGLSTRYVNSSLVLYRVYGSSAYMSPEMISKQGYGRGTDVWSTGVLFYVVLNGQFPFGKASMHRQDMKAAIVDGKEPVGFTRREEESWSVMKEAAMNLVKGLLNRPDKKRLQIKQALKMPFFANELTEEELKELLVKREPSAKRREEKPKEEVVDGNEEKEKEEKKKKKPKEGKAEDGVPELEDAKQKKKSKEKAQQVQQLPSGEVRKKQLPPIVLNGQSSDAGAASGGLSPRMASRQSGSGSVYKDSIRRLAAHGFLQSSGDDGKNQASGARPNNIPGAKKAGEQKDISGHQRSQEVRGRNRHNFDNIMPNGNAEGQKIQLPSQPDDLD